MARQENPPRIARHDASQAGHVGVGSARRELGDRQVEFIVWLPWRCVMQVKVRPTIATRLRMAAVELDFVHQVREI